MSVKELSNIVWELFDNKHILAYLPDDINSELISQRWWDWSFKNNAQDFVHINIANLWWRKGDRYISNKQNYEVSFNEQWSALASLSIDLKHLWTKSLISDFYQAYIRIYLPKNIKFQENILNFKDEERIYKELDSTVIAWLIHMQPWESHHIELEYELPKSFKISDYDLKIIPQAGWVWENWSIAVQAPTDNFWTWDVWNISENLARFNWIVNSDLHLKLSSSWDEFPPIVVWQRFKDTNIIEVNFSEKLNWDFLNDIKNFKLVDKNEANMEKDDVAVERWYMEWNSLFLEISWASYQKWEHYMLLISDITDIAGNYTSNNPLELTVVQD